MLISKMNRFIEKHGTAALIILALALIVPLLFSWMPGRGMLGAGGGGVKSSKYVGEMYGKKLRRDVLYRNIYAVELPMFLMYGRWMHEDSDRYEDLRDAALDRIRLVKEAKRLGLDQYVTTEDVNDRVRLMFSMPGQGFSPETYDAFVLNVLPRLGLDEREFTKIIRESLMVEQLRQQITETIVVSDEEADAENREQLATYTCRQAVFKHSDYMQKVELVSDADIRAYFQEHKETLRLPDMRTVVLAAFTADQFAGDVKIEDQAVQDYYNLRKETYEKQEKSFADVKESIANLLKRQKQNEKTRQAATQMATQLAAADLSSQSVPEVFAAAAEKTGVGMKTSGAFSKYTQSDIENFPEDKTSRLKNAALTLTPENPFSAAIPHQGAYYVMALAETIPGKPAEELTDELKASLESELETAVAREYYNTHIVPFQNLLEGMNTAQDLVTQFAGGELEGKLPELARDMEAEAFRQMVNEKLSPFFNETMKQAAVVVFNQDDYMPRVKGPTETEIQAAYDKKKADYGAQVKASHILMKTQGMDDEAKAAQKAKLEALEKQLGEGRTFEELATEHSEGPSASRGGDVGFFGRGQMVKPFEEAAFALEKGEVSDIVETTFGYHLIKVTDVKPEKTLAEVKPELIQTVKEEKALAMARAAADEFAYGAFDEVTARNEATAPVEAFAAFAEKQEKPMQETRWFRSRGFTPPFSGDWSAVGDAFKVTEEDPVSPVIAGKTRMYVVCWMGTRPGNLPDFDGEPSTVTRVNSLIVKERAITMAEEAAEAAAEDINQKLDEGLDFKTAAGSVTFTDVADFTLAEPPSDGNGALIAESAQETDPGTVSEPVDIPLGALLVYVEKVTQVSDEVLAEKREATRLRLQREKQQAEFESFTEDLEAASETVLTDV